MRYNSAYDVKQPNVSCAFGLFLSRGAFAECRRKLYRFGALATFKKKGRALIFAQGSGQNTNIIPRPSSSAKWLGRVSPLSCTALHVRLLSSTAVLRGQEVSNDHCYPGCCAPGLVGTMHCAGACALHGPPDHTGSSRSASTHDTLVLTAPAAGRRVGPVAAAWW